jgi:hypothetical protein
MKRLFILSILVMLTIGTAGCQCGRLFNWRGARFSQPACGQPACGPCGNTVGGMPILTEPATLPGPSPVVITNQS